MVGPADACDALWGFGDGGFAKGMLDGDREGGLGVGPAGAVAGALVGGVCVSARSQSEGEGSCGKGKCENPEGFVHLGSF